MSEAYVLWILASTWLFTTYALIRVLQARTRLPGWLRGTIAAMLACIAAFGAGCVTVFNPLLVLPFSQETLEWLHLAEQGLLIVVGLRLALSRPRHETISSSAVATRSEAGRDLRCPPCQ